MENSKNKKYAFVFLIIYTAALLYMLFFAFGRLGNRNVENGYKYSLVINRIPLWIPSEFSKRWLFSLGNLLLFVPYGILLPMIFNINYVKTLLTFLCFIVAVETTQLVTYLGYFDAEDILINTIGMTQGYISYKIGMNGKTSVGKGLITIVVIFISTFLLIGFAEIINPLINQK